MTSSTIERSAVESAMSEVGYGHYRRYAGSLADHLNRTGLSVEAVQSFAAQQGARVDAQTAERFVGQINGDAPTPAGGHPEVTEAEGFDREEAARVIRAFLIDVEDYEDDEVTALLVLAGIEDEPEPEPEVVEEPEAEDDTPAWAKRLLDKVESLASFARRHGYDG
jgi:hypothetical protein